MNEQIDRYLSKAVSSIDNKSGSNFEILKDVLKAVPNPKLLNIVLSHLGEEISCRGELLSQLVESERIYKKFAHILRR